MSLADIPGLGAYLQRRQQNEQAPMAELQQVTAAQGLLAKMQEQQQAAGLREALAASGGDVEKAMQAAITSGNVKAAHELAPLVKMAQESRARKETQDGLAALNNPQPAAAGQPMELGAGQPVRVAGEDAAPAAIDPKAGRREALTKMMSLYANNPVVAQRLAAEIDKLDAQKPLIEHNFSIGENMVQPHISTDNGQTWKPIPGSQPSAKFARQLPPVVTVTTGEAATGLSKQYGADETYKKNVDYWAKLLADGGTLPPRFAQSGAGKKMMPDILNVVPTISKDSTEMLANQVELTGQKSEARTVGTRAANVEMAAGEAREMMPILLKTSQDFERTGYQPINKVIKAYQDNTGSVESRQFGAALNTFINVYARAVSPSGVPTVSDKDHAREVLSTADSHEQLVGLLKVLDQEMVAAQNAPKRVRDAQRAGMTGKAAPGHAPASSPTVDSLLEKYK